MVEFRDATPADALGIATVQVASWQVAYRGQLPDEMLDGLSVPARERAWSQILTDAAPHTRVVLAVADAAVIGFAAAGPATDAADQTVGELYAIYLDPASWGTGAGRRLHALALDGLRAEGFATAVLWVLDANARAHRFYDRAGWVDSGRTRVGEVSGGVERQLTHPLAELVR